ncbi:MAG TPA: S8 family peptidase [Pyrinomonadaceae bacterium]|jgi:subtilisin family serine protease
MKRKLALLLTLALFTVALPPFFVVQGQGPIQQDKANKPAAKFRKVEGAIHNQYIVVFKDDTARPEIAPLAKKLARLHGGKIMFIYEDALKGFAVELPEAAALALSNNPQVAYVEENGFAVVSGTESTPDDSNTFWGLDRIDQTDLPLSQTYNYNRVGSGVHAYVLDTGIWVTHTEFGTRAHTSADGGGYDSYGGDGIDRSPSSHGTEVAGVIGGRTYGVAKNVQLHSVKVCEFNYSLGYDTCPNANIIAGINWVINNHIKPAVINMSFGGPANSSMDTAVRNASGAGITCVAAAGNDARELLPDNYGYLSPARVSQAITVGATTETDGAAFYSNYGSALDVWAPAGNYTIGEYIPVPANGQTNGRDDNRSGFSGTSAAAPHVAGVVALYLESYSLTPSDPATLPANVSYAITANATPGRISDIPESCYWDYYTGEYYCYTTSPNLLLYSGFVAPPASNPIDDTRFFVRQQYYDFLRRTPDALWENWISYVNGCGGDAQCLNSRRITMTRGVIESLEFKQRDPILLNNSPGTPAYNEEYVRQLYICLLQRQPDGNSAAWLNYINSTGDYDGLVGGFINSAEYRARFL